MLRLLILFPIGALRFFILCSIAMFRFFLLFSISMLRLLLLPFAMLRLFLLLSIAFVLSSCASQTASNKQPAFGKGWEASAYTSGTVGTGR
jgi:hypothetical protein